MFKLGEHAPPDGPIPGTPFYLQNNKDVLGQPDGTAKILLYLPNGSIGGVFIERMELFKTTLEALLAGTPGQVTITQSAPEPGGEGGLTTNVNTAKQPAHTPVKGKK